MDLELSTEPDSYDSNEIVEWAKSNLLSLDGGGIRGYWSLLALQKLMEYIADEEQHLDEDVEVLHSFYPQAWPDDVSRGPLSATEERKNIENAEDLEGRCRAMLKARRFLPCHYFDHICGSSTGALIAIMLGRFRMTVLDCIDEYKSLGEEVFGSPRVFSTLRFGVGNRTKYKAKRLETVFKNVTARRNEYLADPDRSITFPSGRGLCKTFVTTLRTEPGGTQETLYLIRSYDHEERNDPIPPNATSRGNTTFTGRSNTARSNTGLTEMNGGMRREAKRSDTINHGKAQKFEIWEVARAATAARFYFEPLRIQLPGSNEHMRFEDGGFGNANNPTLEGTHELEDLYGHNLVGIVVSVGTARKEEHNKKGAFFLTVPRATKKFASVATDPEAVHRSMDRRSQRTNKGSSLSYFRLNDPGKLGVELDEWEPKKRMFNKISGSTTLNTIEGSFSKWACDIDNTRQLRECAAALVKCRRVRVMDEAKWERFATGARFTCRSRKCDSEDFLDRTLFREHLREKHPERMNSQGQEEKACRKTWRYQHPVEVTKGVRRNE